MCSKGQCLNGKNFSESLRKRTAALYECIECSEDNKSWDNYRKYKPYQTSDDTNITDIHKDQNLRIELQKLLSNCSGNLSQEQKRGVENLLNEYKNLFAAYDRDLGRTNLVHHTINTGNNAPVKQPPRRTPIYMRGEVDRHIHDMLERGVIEPADGPWSSGIVLVKKKDGTTRFALIIARQCGYSSDWKAQQLVQTVSSKPDECERDKEDDTEISLKHFQGNDKNLQIVRPWVQDGQRPNLKKSRRVQLCY
ncbi:unnamed protein product [Mytilus edulis]|uniref:Peptidase A9 domain-containing protein n=1 Tax=Mytilus edulis TaxID=6550 RepID=A0A8S3PUZ3_MYTED|nr:unnamed protein product [Mytilus edulis]